MSTSFKIDPRGYWILKDPDAKLDYQVNWAEPTDSWLGTDTLVATSWTVEAGLTKESDTFTSTTATIWLSGGTVGKTYNVTIRITTATGRVDDRSFRIIVKQR